LILATAKKPFRRFSLIKTKEYVHYRFATLTLSNFDSAASFTIGCTLAFIIKLPLLTFTSTAQNP
jgi:hypothetical protein